MAAAITVESLDSVKALVDEEDALVTYRRLADEAALMERFPPSWSAPWGAGC